MSYIIRSPKAYVCSAMLGLMKRQCIQQLTCLLLSVLCLQHASARSLRQSALATDCQPVRSIPELGQAVQSFAGQGSAQLCLQQLPDDGGLDDTCASPTALSLTE